MVCSVPETVLMGADIVGGCGLGVDGSVCSKVLLVFTVYIIYYYFPSIYCYLYVSTSLNVRKALILSLQIKPLIY